MVGGQLAHLEAAEGGGLVGGARHLLDARLAQGRVALARHALDHPREGGSLAALVEDLPGDALEAVRLASLEQDLADGVLGRSGLQRDRGREEGEEERAHILIV